MDPLLTKVTEFHPLESQAHDKEGKPTACLDKSHSESQNSWLISSSSEPTLGACRYGFPQSTARHHDLESLFKDGQQRVGSEVTRSKATHLVNLTTLGISHA